MDHAATNTRRPPRVFSPRRLAAARRAKGLRQREMAEALGLSFVQAYQRYEYGQHHPSTETLPQLADLLDVTIDSLFAIPEEEASQPGNG